MPSSSPPHLLRAALAPCTTFAFDLDDTLHSFRAASSTAATAVFEKISSRHPGSTTATDIDNLRAAYADILQRATATAFADGRSSDEYRKERFAALLRAAGVVVGGDGGLLDELARVYEEALGAALVLKPGARECVEAAKEKEGGVVVVVTEGPRDAQEWTVRELGLAALVDRVVTTGEVGRGKVEAGFWDEVLGRLGGGLRAEDVVVVGDSWERDVLPARGAGCVVVWFCEGGWEGEGRDGVLCVDDLRRLAEVV